MINDDAQHADALLRANAELSAEVARLRADNAALRHAITIALPTIDAFGDSRLDMVAEHLEVWRDKEHPGRAMLAELTAARAVVAAMREIDRHVIGAYALSWDAMPEPCEECGDMREIASQALAAYDKAVKASK